MSNVAEAIRYLVIPGANPDFPKSVRGVSALALALAMGGSVMTLVDQIDSTIRATLQELHRASEDRDAFTVKQFCDRHSMSRTTFYKMKEAGEAPRTFYVGNSLRVSREAAADWRRAREDAESALSGGPAVCS